MRKIVIALDFTKKQIRIPCKLWNKTVNGYTDVMTVLDTGCASTIANENIIKNMGYELTKVDKKSHGVTAPAPIKQCIIPSFKINGVQQPKLKLDTTNFNKHLEIDMLLGMDVLQFFNITIDFTRVQVVLEQRNIKNIPHDEWFTYGAVVSEPENLLLNTLSKTVQDVKDSFSNSLYKSNKEKEQKQKWTRKAHTRTVNGKKVKVKGTVIKRHDKK